MGLFADIRKRREARDQSASAGRLIETGTWRIGLLVNLVAVVAAALFVQDSEDALQVFATAVVIYMAASVVGMFAGFLFGLPRATAKDDAATRETQFFFNSNLIKVSDWLTTIIVGVTLINVRSVGSAFGDLANKLGPPLGGEAGSDAFGLALVIFGFTLGAVLMYLWSTLRLRELLEQAEREATKLIKEAQDQLKTAIKDEGIGGDAVKRVVEDLPAGVVADLRTQVESDPLNRWSAQERSGVLDLLNERIKDPTDPASS